MSRGNSNDHFDENLVEACSPTHRFPHFHVPCSKCTQIPVDYALDQQDLVADLVNDAVVTDADAIHRVLPPHRHMTQR